MRLLHTFHERTIDFSALKVIVCGLLVLLQSICAGHAYAGQEMAFDTVTVTLSDTFERLGYSGNSIGFQTSGERLSSNSRAQYETQKDSYKIYSGKSARESVQLQLVSSVGEKLVTNVEISGFRNAETDSELPIPTAYLVGNIRESKSSGIDSVAFPDVLIPLNDIEEKVTYAGGIRFLFDFSIPSTVSSGNHEGSIAIEFADGTGIVIPIIVIVWNFEIPPEQSVAMQLFQLDKRSIAYWYGLDPWDPALLKILDDGAGLLVDHRFSLSSVLPYSIEDKSKYPALIEESDSLDFDRGNILERHVATFDQLGNAFSLKLQASFDDRSSGVFLRHQWHNRKSGYRVSYSNGEVTFEAWTRGEGDSIESPPNLLTLTQAVDASEFIHDIEFSLSDSLWALSVDGEKAVETRLENIIPAFGGWVTLGSRRSKFRLYDIDWYVAEGPSFSKTSVFGRWIEYLTRDGVRSGAETKQAARESLRRWAEFSLNSDAQINDLKFSPRESIDKIVATHAAIDDLLEDRTYYVSLPHDEAYRGESAERNIRFAREMREKLPEIEIFHTFGAMRGAGMSKGVRREILEKFRSHVDIFSLRPSVYFENKDFFDKHESSGIDISMYIHDVNILERDDVLLLGRGFFWNLYELGASRVSFWNTSLWFQPEKPGRPARILTKAADGYAVTKRNPSGLGAGMIFYPGKSGLLPSLRSIAWRDGLEDFEMLQMIDSVAQYTGESDVMRSYAKEALSQKERMDIPIHDRRDFRKVPANWKIKLRESRQAMGSLLELVAAAR